MVSGSLDRTPRKAPPTAISVSPTPGRKFDGHRGHVSSFVFLHDNIHIVSSSLDGTIRKWDCETGLLIGEPWKGQGGRINELALSPDGKIIACGRGDGSVQKWKTHGEMIEDWMDHTSSVEALSWSRNGSHIASGSSDGTILIRKAASGEVEVGPIETNQRCLYSIAYSPSGDRIASGGYNNTICIWDSCTGELCVGPIQDLGFLVMSVVWSSNGSKLYSASDEFIRIFDSISGAELHRFQHGGLLYSLALSPTHNLLACVGARGIAQLWDTESLQPLGHSFHKGDREYLAYVSFSQDGRYLAYGGSDGEITLWMVKDITSPAAVPSTNIHGATTLPKFPTPSCLDIDATEPFAESGFGYVTGSDGPYDNFFAVSQSSLPGPSPRRRLRKVFSIPSLLRPPENGPTRLQGRLTPHRNPLHSALPMPTNNKPNGPTPRRQVKARNEREGRDNVNCSTDSILNTIKQNSDEGKRGEEPLVDSLVEILPSHNPSTSAKFNDDEYRVSWKLRMRFRKNDNKKAQVKMTHESSPKVVEVHPVRGFQRYVVHKRKHKSKTPNVMISVHSTAAHVGSASQAHAYLETAPGHGSRCSQGFEVPSSRLHVSESSPTHFATSESYDPNDESDSDSSIQGTCNKVLYKLCFPRGHSH